MPPAQQNGRSYTSRVAVIMLLVLAAAVAAAYWLVYTRTQRPEHAGRDIIADIRDRGLAHYWGDEPMDIRLARRDGSGVRRWQREHEDGRYEGTFALDGRVQTAQAKWRLAADMSTGRYESQGVYLRQGGLTKTTTEIVVDGRQIEVTSDGGRARATIPDNYIPEGTLHLVARHVAQRGDRAAFSMILDGRSLSADGQVWFSSVIMTPLSPRRVRVRMASGTSSSISIIEFDDAGDVLRYTVVSADGASKEYVRVENRDRESR
ncbi:MAG: hypothetical protein KGY99_05275 [Phycisphaerae bacterium]|nr:hypothetical protein [Phycisphaerae bacterium]